MAGEPGRPGRVGAGGGSRGRCRGDLQSALVELALHPRAPPDRPRSASPGRRSRRRPCGERGSRRPAPRRPRSVVEPGAAQRNLELPDLFRVARLGGELDPRRHARRRPDRRRTGGSGRRARRARPSPPRGRTRRCARGRSRAYSAVRSDISAPTALRAAPSVGEHHARAAEALGDRHRVDPRGAAAGDEHGVAGVDAAVERDVLDRAHHVLGREPEHCDRGVLGRRDSSGVADVALDRLPRGVAGRAQSRRRGSSRDRCSRARPPRR